MRRAVELPTANERILKRDDLRKVGNIFAVELRLLVANYYLTQEMRKRVDMQLRHLGDKELMTITKLGPEVFAGYEEGIVKSFKKEVQKDTVGRWVMAQRGIGPIIAAGLLAHIDINQAPTAGHIWRFAGLDPSQKWEKGQKRPFNAQLKQICWHAGQCFMKQSNDPDCFYGKLYRQKKQEYIVRNEAGGFAEKAKVYKGVTDKTNKKLLADGKVPAAYIDSCARRFAVKIFLSHLHAVLHWHYLKRPAPLPAAIALFGHAHLIEIPHADLIPGLAAHEESTALRERAVHVESTDIGEPSYQRVPPHASEPLD